MVRFLLTAVAVISVAWASPGLAADVSAYGRLPAIDHVTLSPSGARLAYISLAGDQRRLVVLELPEKVLMNVAVGDTKVRDTYWVGEEHLLVEITNTQSEDFSYYQTEMRQYISVNVETQKALPVFSNDPTIFHAVFGNAGSAVVGNHAYGFFAGVTMEKASGFDGFDRELGHLFPDLYKVDLDTGSNSIVAHGSLLHHEWAVDASGVLIAHSDYDQTSAEWNLYANGNGGHLVSKGKDPLWKNTLDGEGRDPGTVIIYGDQPEEWTLADGSHRPLPSEDDRGVESTLRDPVTGRVAGVRWLGDTPGFQFFDPLLQARYKSMQRALGLTIVPTSWSTDYKRLVVKTEGKGDSGTYWLIDGAQASIIDNPYPGVAAAAVGESRVISYKATDGLEVHGILTLPQGRPSRNLPVVVIVHDGPEAHDELGFDWMAEAYVAQGYAVFRPNFRGSDGYAFAFRDAGYGQWGRKMQTDISDGLAELERNGTVDPKRACILGIGYGGYAALAGVTMQQGLYRCSVSIGGIADLKQLLALDAEKNRTAALRYWRNFMGAGSDSAPILQDLSPSKLATKADAPVLLIHGLDDTTMSVDQSRTMESALRAAGKPVELIIVKDQDHWLSRESGRQTTLAAAVDFVIKHNPPDPAVAVAAATPPGSSK